ncbi:hypothetical protein [Pontimicrobium aquaticum]|uniref:Uncharacterized protein n=1 Tax=Pontimicrobium aquaticum TaxID=2565367 RepID=A0A4V5LQY7_9FLAO|nr:hypothetical protein [Pontimicrobium aquaticum]TJY37209.1 hypothetical protein E5167_04470 [Pontimicrobium aquaticum]
MRKFKILMLVAMCSLGSSFAQERDKQTKEEKLSYYEQRAKEDAKFEQELKAKTEKESAEFWENQKQYEEDLKKRDRKAYRAYIKGKRDAYAEHYAHCGTHCHHSDYYHHHVSFYYYGYNNNHYYNSYPRRNAINTRIKIGTPRVRLGIF